MTNLQTFISVIIPVYNGETFLNQCLNALFNSDYKDFEVIVVDDGSSDNSAEISRAKGAIVISTPHRQSGPAAARNLAAASAAKGEILVFVDADVVVKPDTLFKIAENFRQNSEISALFGSYDDEPKEKNFLSQYKNLQHHFVHQHSNSEAATFWTGLGAIRRDVFLAFGGFDCEKYPVPSIEDIELGVRLRSAGHQILLDKEIQAKHLKKWKFVSLIKTEVFCRALPWSKLILTNQGLINDLNLKKSDRLSAILVGLSLILTPFIFWQSALLILLGIFLLMVFLLNRKIFNFFAEKKGKLFAVCAFPWQVFYFFYSGITFVFCWFRYALPLNLGFNKEKTADVKSLI